MKGLSLLILPASRAAGFGGSPESPAPRESLSYVETNKQIKQALTRVGENSFKRRLKIKTKPNLAMRPPLPIQTMLI